MSARASKIRLEQQLRDVLEKEARLDEELRELLQVMQNGRTDLFHILQNK